MNNLEIGKKVKELRNRKGFSQEELAEITQLSLRTIQRIENGETEARGDSLKRIAQALNITPEELTGQIIKPEEQEANNRFLMLLNLSALSFLIFPILGIIAPLVLWSLKKNTVKNIDVASKRLVNFQISWFILVTIIPIVILLMFIFHIRLKSVQFSNLLDGLYLMVGVLGLYGLNFLYIVFNAFRVYQNKQVIYKPAIPFIR